MNIKNLGSFQKSVLRWLTVDGSYICKFSDSDGDIFYGVFYDATMVGTECNDSFRMVRSEFESLLNRKLFTEKYIPASLPMDIVAYKLTDEAKYLIKQVFNISWHITSYALAVCVGK